MGQKTVKRPRSKVENPNQGLRIFVLFLIPIILLVAVSALCLQTGGGLSFKTPAPVENLTVERLILSGPPESVYHIQLIVRNNSPQPVTIAQVVVNDGVRPFTMERRFPWPSRLHRATRAICSFGP